jgi:hypothetical protein
VFDADTGTVAIPATLAEAYRVEFQNSEGRWREIKRANSPGADGWTAEPSNAVLRIEGQPAWDADTYSIRIHGYERQALLSALTDTCAFDSGGIVARAAYRLTMSALDRDPKYAQQLLIYRQEADDAMSRLRVLRQPGTVQVRL